MNASVAGVDELFHRAVTDYRAGRLAQAEDALRQATAAKPDHAQAFHLLGVIAHQRGFNAQAADHIRMAISWDAAQASYRCNLGVVLDELGQFEEAEASLRAALRLRPEYPEALNNLGKVLTERGRPAQAEESLRAALALRPDSRDALNNLGNALSDLGRAQEAEDTLRRALRLQPDTPDALNNLGVALSQLGRSSEAEASFQAALRLRPDYPDAHSNLGAAQFDLRRLAEAEASYRQALRLRPDFVDARRNLACLALITGRYAEGWEENEWRWKTKHMAPAVRNFPAPLWGGEAIGGRVILLHAEQGLGDTLQFCRYAPLIEAGAKVVLEVQAPLVRLLSRMPGVAQIVARGEALPSFDLHCPLMSLPRAFGTRLETIPAAPYLAAEPADAAMWRERLSGLVGLKVGLVWAGEPRAGFADLEAIDARRSMALATLGPLAEAPGVSFVSLQKGKSATQAAVPPPAMSLVDHTADLKDFADTAALIDNLDLVISVDTSVAHLAGGMGKPVWLLNRFDTCWRWLLDRDDSPWYPTLRQFRQPSPGDWAKRHRHRARGAGGACRGGSSPAAAAIGRGRAGG